MSEIKLINGDCLVEMKNIPNNSVDSIVTDPPYELGFMGKSWDSTGIANNREMWAECLRVLKPGGHLLAFSGTRTYHRMATAIEDAGFEVRDMIEWVYGSGFPKSLNIGKAVDRLQGNERELLATETRYNEPSGIVGVGQGERTLIDRKITKGTSKWEGWGTALKPAHEPICMARKPLAEKTVAENCLKYGTGGINIDESRVKHNEPIKMMKAQSGGDKIYGQSGRRVDMPELKENGRFPANLIHDNSEEVRECFPEAKGANSQNNYSNGKIYRGQSLLESETKLYGHRDWYNDNGNASRFFKSIIYQAKVSKSERNLGCEGLEEKIQNNTETNSRTFNDRCLTCKKKFVGSDNTICHCPPELKITDKTIYTNKNNHPTVKPIALMEYLIKMITPKGGIVLDPFMGSGSTGVAAKKNGYDFIGIEIEEEYIKIAKARIENHKVQEKLTN